MGDVAVVVHVVLPPQVAADNKKSSSLFTYMNETLLWQMHKDILHPAKWKTFRLLFSDFFLHRSGLIQTAKEIKAIFARATNDTGVVNKLNEQRVAINWLCGFLHHLFTHPGGPTCKNESFVRAFCYCVNIHSWRCQMSGSCRAFQLLATRRTTDWRKLPACGFQCRKAFFFFSPPALTLSNYKRVQILFSQ